MKIRKDGLPLSPFFSFSFLLLLSLSSIYLLCFPASLTDSDLLHLCCSNVGDQNHSSS